MTEVASLVATVNGKDVGLEALLRRVDQLGRQTADNLQRSGQQIGAGIGAGAGRATPAVAGLGATSLRASQNALSLAQAQARASAASGDYAGAVNRLSSALQNAEVVSLRQGFALQAQITRYEQAAAAARAKAAAEAQAASQAGGALNVLAGAAGTVGVALALPAAISGAAALAEQGAQAELVAQRFDGLAQAAGTTGAALLGALRSASGGEINDLNLQLAANRGQLLGVADSAEEFATLMGIARDRAQQMGISTEQAFNDLVTGLGRGSALILDNLGITVSVTEANKAYAAQLGKNVSALTEAEQKQALINAVLQQGQASLDATGGAAESNSGKIARFTATLSNLANTLGAGIAGQVTPTLDVVSGLVNAFDGSRESILRYVDAANTYIGANQGVAEANRGAAGAVLDFLGIQDQAAQAAGAAAATEAANAATRQALAQSYADGRISIEQYDAAMRQLQQATQSSTGAAQGEAQSIQDAAAAKLLAAANADTLAVSEQQLADQAMGAAQAVVSGGGNIEATAARLAASSSLVDQLTAAYIRLLAAQQAAGIAGQKRLAGQAAETRDLTGGRGVVIGAPGRTGSGDPNAVLKFIKDQEAAAAATRDQNFALANQAGQISILEGELKNLTPGTAEYIKKQTELLQLQNRQATGGGRAGTQSKEQAALLKGQTDYQNKSLDAEQEYQDERTKIAADAAEKRAAAENAFRQGQLDSRASFYRSLAGIEDQDVAKDLSAKYEQAAQQAAEIARTQGADVAKEFLDAQRDAIQGQADLQKEIAAAEKDGDKGKAEYYKGLLKLQQDADAERLRQIQESGSEIANQEQAEYAAAEQRYAEHLERMGVLYERKFGQAPPGAAPGGPGAAGGATVAPGPTTVPTAAGQAPGTTLVTDPGTQAAIDALGARLEGKLGAIEEKVGAVETRVGDVVSAVGKIRTSSGSALAG